jgi:hypothetical protein
VENPLPVRPYDGATVIADRNHSLVLEILQGNAKKNLGQMKISWK